MSFQVVLSLVCDIKFTLNVLAETSFTVNEVPSNVTEPFGAIKCERSFGI